MLTCNTNSSNDFSDAIFSPAHNVQQMQISCIEQNEIYPNEYIAKISNGSNKTSFKLGQRFGFIFHILCLFFLIFGLASAKNLPPKPVNLQQKEYNTYAFNCHAPNSIKYIDKAKRCNYNPQNVNDETPIDWDILVHPLKQSYKGNYCSIIRSTTKIRCGLWSYNQLLAVPETEVNVHISDSDCKSMIQ